MVVKQGESRVATRRKQFARFIRYAAPCATLFLTSFVTSLFSIGIDLSCPDSRLTIPFPEEAEGMLTFEINNISSDTIYALQFQGGFEALTCLNPYVILGANNSLLIENESQLTGETVFVNATFSIRNGKEVIEVDKIAVAMDEYPQLGNKGWGSFVDAVRGVCTPREATRHLVEIANETSLKNVLTLGCESGRDSLYFAALESDVTILDATPHAIAITCLRFAEQDLLNRLKKALVCTLEAAPSALFETFDAVTGGQVFSFILPSQFIDVMTNKILPCVAPAGYFSGHFLASDHEWRHNPALTFVTKDDLEKLFEGNGFEIVWLNEERSVCETVLDGAVFWHEFQVVARKKSVIGRFL